VIYHQVKTVKEKIKIMKKLSIILLLVLLGNLASFGDGAIKQYPIPSFGQKIIGTSAFAESATAPGNDHYKRQMNVQSTTISPKVGECTITAWLIANGGLNVLGPFTVDCGETLSVPIDNQRWSVVIQSDYPVSVDVWIDSGSSGQY